MAPGETRGGSRRGGWLKRGVATAGWLGVATFGSAAWAEDPSPSTLVEIGFSNLLARVDSEQIALAKPEYRVHILEALRAAGFNAVGAENLVFDQDKASKAKLLLGGTVKELQCAHVSGALHCRIGVEWQLWDRAQDRVVYRVISRYLDQRVPEREPEKAGKALVMGALGRLMQRPQFKKLAGAHSAPLQRDDEFDAATFRECQGATYELPRDFERVADGTVMVKTDSGFGSGFFLGPDGLVLTAAHVVDSGSVKLRMHDGSLLTARVVRISHRSDVALLSAGNSNAPFSCLALSSAKQTPGNDVYAIGSPASEDLAFSLSRGIVSGVRNINELSLLQTDASLSPGNSGGAMIDKEGRAVGVVSRKIAGRAVEGLGFAIPIDSALAALKLQAGATTTPELLVKPIAAVETTSSVIVDHPDPEWSLDPVGDRQRLFEADLANREQRRREKTPAYLHVMRWGGAAVASVGGYLVLASYSVNQGDVTRKEYQSLRTQNDLGWVAVAVGAAGFVTSFVLAPSLEPSTLEPAKRVSLLAGPGRVGVGVMF